MKFFKGRSSKKSPKEKKKQEKVVEETKDYASQLEDIVQDTPQVKPASNDDIEDLFDESEFDDLIADLEEPKEKPKAKKVEKVVADEIAEDEDDDEFSLEPVPEAKSEKEGQPKAPKPNRHPVRSFSPEDILKQRPVKVTDEASAKLAILQGKTIDEATDDDFDQMNTDRAIALMSELDLSEPDAEVEEDDDLDFTDLNELKDEPEPVVEAPAPEPEPEVVADPDFENDAADFENDTVEEEPELTPAIDPTQITPEQAYAALTPVQQVILDQMEKIDFETRRTQAQMVEENLYMQGQITEWSDAYAQQMKHLEDWQEYADKLRGMIVQQNDEFEQEREELNRRHHLQMRNLRASLEQDFQKREAALVENQETAKRILAQAEDVRKDAKDREDNYKEIIAGLQRQIKILTTRPQNPGAGATPVPPTTSSDDLFKDLIPKKQAETKIDDTDDLFSDEAW